MKKRPYNVYPEAQYGCPISGYPHNNSAHSVPRTLKSSLHIVLPVMLTNTYKLHGREFLWPTVPCISYETVLWMS